MLRLHQEDASLSLDQSKDKYFSRKLKASINVFTHIAGGFTLYNLLHINFIKVCNSMLVQFSLWVGSTLRLVTVFVYYKINKNAKY